MRHFPLRQFRYAIGFNVLLAAIYVGPYFAMVQRQFTRGPFCDARYRFGSDWTVNFFSPMYQFDHKIRPEFWFPEDYPR